MKPKLFIIFLLIVLLPLGLLMWLGSRVAHYEQEDIQWKFRELLLKQLSDVDESITQFIEKRERELLRLTNISFPDAGTLRQIARKNAFIRQVFHLDPDSNILHPSPNSQLNEAEWDFLERTKEIIIDKNLIYQSESDVSPIEQQPPQKKAKYQRKSKRPIQAQQQAIPQSKKQKTHGWYVWYWGRGVHLLFWRQDRLGNIIGVELDRIRLLSDIIGLLPGTDSMETYPLQSRITMSNASGQIVYQWGTYESTEKEPPIAEKSLSYPLNAWKLKYYLPPEHLSTSGGMYFSLISSLAAAGLALMGLAVYFYRESSREIRNAAQRVSFVNRVSHELKTPLTNIRMYAELLENQMSDKNEKAQKHLNVIVSESKRLSRLIGNILSFSRRQRNKLHLHLSTGVVDDVIRCVLDNFKPAFKNQQIQTAFDGKADRHVRFDRDAVEQILGNLFNNVEKYAASGRFLKVQSRHENMYTIITVTDRGPGIPTRQRGKIFLPFSRISNKVNDGVSGAGIGLSIALDLARLHGGDLVTLPTSSGAVFQLRISTPQPSDGEKS